MDCEICYGTGRDPVFLDCKHSLCGKCFVKLERKVCPFCRAEIGSHIKPLPKKKIIYNEEKVKKISLNYKGRTLKIISEIFQIGNTTLIIEFPVKYKKNAKNNFKKGRWAVSNFKNRKHI